MMTAERVGLFQYLRFREGVFVRGVFRVDGAVRGGRAVDFDGRRAGSGDELVGGDG